MTSVAANPLDFEEEAKKAREYYMCKISVFCLTTSERSFTLDGEYSKGITFYKLAIEKLRRYCQTLSNGAEKKRGSDVRTERSMLLTSACLGSSLVSGRAGTRTSIHDRT